MRVTVDLDKCGYLRLLMTYFNARYLTGREPEIRRSASGRGYHLIVRGLRTTWDGCFVLRRLLGDDGTRVLFDEASVRPRQVLWESKRGRHVEAVDPRSLLSSPWKVLREVKKPWLRRHRLRRLRLRVSGR
jgi:hypothetical protein